MAIRKSTKNNNKNYNDIIEEEKKNNNFVDVVSPATNLVEELNNFSDKTNSPSIVSYPFIVLLLVLVIFYKNFILYIIIKNNFSNYGFNWKYFY